MNLLKHFTAVGASLVLIGAFNTVQATSTDVVLNLEGNPTCSSLGDNSVVQVFKDSNPGGTRELTLSLPNGGGIQKLSYTVVPVDGIDRITTWDIIEVNGNPVNGTEEQQDLFYAQVNAINYIILKAQGGNNGARVFHYGTSDDDEGTGSPGAITDEVLVSPGPILAAVSFCYGLTTSFVQVEEPEPPLPVLACEDLSTSELDGTGISCEDGGEERLLINMELNAKNFGFDDAFHACTCNVTDTSKPSGYTGLPQCNPARDAQRVNSLGQFVDAATGILFVDQDGNLINEGAGPGITGDDLLSPEDRTCLEYNPDDPGSGTTVPTGVNERVPVIIQGVENPDSYICITQDGVRTCYGHY